MIHAFDRSIAFSGASLAAFHFVAAGFRVLDRVTSCKGLSLRKLLILE